MLKYIKENYIPKNQIKNFPLYVIDKMIESTMEAKEKFSNEPIKDVDEYVNYILNIFEDHLYIAFCRDKETDKLILNKDYHTILDQYVLFNMDWSRTKEGADFWKRVFLNEDFEYFRQKYPQD